jgi:hypothetical protein
LTRLVETERRHEAVLAAARADGAQRVAAAREAARAREAALAADLDAAGRALEAEIAAEQARREAEIAAAGVRDATRYDSVTPERIAELAQDVVRRLIAGAADA